MYSQVVIALALAVSATATLFTEQDASQKYTWESYKLEYGKSYDEEENTHRFSIFIENMKVADERNMLEKAANGTAVHGITKFSDLSQEEFASRYLTTKIPEGLKESTKRVSLKPPASGASADWVGTYTTPVKDQGYCGSCWAFSVTEQLESDSMRMLGTDYILAPQQLTSCDTGDSGCNGGWPTSGYDYIESAGGLVQETEYPYTSGAAGVTGSCTSADLSDPVVTVTDYYTLSGEKSMAAHMVSTGPIAIAVDASTWSSYTGGILSACGTSIDHAVQAVGVDTSSYWLVRNSWGTSWGESGYIRLAYGANTCDLDYIPTYTDAALA